MIDTLPTVEEMGLAKGHPVTCAVAALLMADKALAKPALNTLDIQVAMAKALVGIGFALLAISEKEE
jgi:hypothetical protein